MPIAIDFTVSLAFVVALLVSFGLLYAWRGIGKPILLSFALLFNVVSVPWIRGAKHPFGFIAAWLENAAEAVDHSLAQLVLNCEKGIVGLWHAMAVQVRLFGRLLGDLAETIEARWRALLLSIPPVALLWLAVRAARQLPAVWKAIGRAEHAITNTATKVIHTTMTVTHATKVYVTRTAHAAAVATVRVAAATVPWVNGRVHGLELDLAGLRARLRNLERPAVLAAGAVVVGVALARLQLGWLRCPRVLQAGKQVCRMDQSLLGTLFADTLAIASVVSLVELASMLVSVTEGLTKTVAYGFKETRGIEPHTFVGYTGTLG